MATNKDGCWDRLEAVINWANMSVNYFARHIGLPRGENLYQIRRGNNGISRDVARRVTSRFPEVNEAWLLTGIGEMFIRPEDRRLFIPFYDVDVEQTLGRDVKLHPASQLSVPIAEASDMAMRYCGLSMAPHIPTGAIVVLGEVAPEEIVPEGEYVLQLDNKTILRTVLPTDAPDMWHIQAYTPQNGYLLEKAAVTRAWAVRAWVKIGNAHNCKKK